MSPHGGLWTNYKLRLKRRRLLWRALRSRRQLTALTNRTRTIRPGAILCFAVMRNEALRLPYFLRHYRDLGVDHFLIVANDCSDDTVALLRDQGDVSLWQTRASYRASRFGMDWAMWLLMRYGAGHWCLTVDADELLVYPECETRPLPELTAWLEARGAEAMAALMLDMYPNGPLSSAHSAPGDDPTQALPLYDAEGYVWDYQPRFGNISIRGGPRRRVFFAQTPDHAPHLHKLPLIRWSRRFAYVSSTHVALPSRLNRGFDARLNLPTGVLLHTKFLDGAPQRAEQEKARGEHFTHAGNYDHYYDSVAADPDLRGPHSQPYDGPRSLVEAGLMAGGDWASDC